MENTKKKRNPHRISTVALIFAASAALGFYLRGKYDARDNANSQVTNDKSATAQVQEPIATPDVIVVEDVKRVEVEDKNFQ